MRPSFNFNVGKHPRKYIRGGVLGNMSGGGGVFVSRGGMPGVLLHGTIAQIQYLQLCKLVHLFLPRRYCSIQLV